MWISRINYPQMIQAPVVRFCFVLAVCARGGNTSLKGQFWPFMQPCLLGVPSAAWRHADRRIGNLLGGASLRPSQNKINCCAGSGGAYGSALGKGKRTGRFPGAALQLWHIFTAGAILPKVIWELSEQLIYHEIPPQLWSKKGGSISSGTCKCITR